MLPQGCSGSHRARLQHCCSSISSHFARPKSTRFVTTVASNHTPRVSLHAALCAMDAIATMNQYLPGGKKCPIVYTITTLNMEPCSPQYNSLTVDLQQQVLKYLNHHDLANMRLVNRATYHTTQNVHWRMRKHLRHRILCFTKLHQYTRMRFQLIPPVAAENKHIELLFDLPFRVALLVPTQNDQDNNDSTMKRFDTTPIDDYRYAAYVHTPSMCSLTGLIGHWWTDSTRS